MAHVQISMGEGVPGTARIEIDGVDVSKIVAVDGFGVSFPNDPGGVATVTLPVIPSRLDIDLPDALIEALDVTPEGGE